MSNSALVNYTKISPNSNNPRNQPIRKITIHHMAGNLTVETCGNVFAPASRQASSNYGIGSDGRVGMYVEEKNRSWCSSSPANDHQAVTIEVANDQIGGNWHVSDKALARLIDLCTDICKRNGIKELNYTGNTNGNLTRHNMFASTSCPGPYLQSKFPYIAAEVNKRLKPAAKPEPPKPPVVPPDKVYTVVRGDTLSGIAAKFKATVKALAEYNKISDPNKIAVGQKIKIPGGSAPVPPTPPTPKFVVGGKVRIKANAGKYSRSTMTIPSVYKGKPYTIQQVGANDVLLKELYSWVNKTDCESV